MQLFKNDNFAGTYGGSKSTFSTNVLQDSRLNVTCRSNLYLLGETQPEMYLGVAKNCQNLKEVKCTDQEKLTASSKCEFITEENVLSFSVITVMDIIPF